MTGRRQGETVPPMWGLSGLLWPERNHHVMSVLALHHGRWTMEELSPWHQLVGNPRDSSKSRGAVLCLHRVGHFLKTDSRPEVHRGKPESNPQRCPHFAPQNLSANQGRFQRVPCLQLGRMHYLTSVSYCCDKYAVRPTQGRKGLCGAQLEVTAVTMVKSWDGSPRRPVTSLPVRSKEQ